LPSLLRLGEAAPDSQLAAIATEPAPVAG